MTARIASSFTSSASSVIPVAFLALGSYEDAPQRAEAIQARIQAREDLAAAKAVFTGENFDEAIAAASPNF